MSLPGARFGTPISVMPRPDDVTPSQLRTVRTRIFTHGARCEFSIRVCYVLST
jgi:hypothetical protein